jgi:hypothetical protein
LNPHLELVAAFDGANPGGSAGEYDVSGQQREMVRNKTDQVRGLEEQLTRIRVLTELAVLE